MLQIGEGKDNQVHQEPVLISNDASLCSAATDFEGEVLSKAANFLRKWAQEWHGYVSAGAGKAP